MLVYVHLVFHSRVQFSRLLVAEQYMCVGVGPRPNEIGALLHG